MEILIMNRHPPGFYNIKDMWPLLVQKFKAVAKPQCWPNLDKSVLYNRLFLISGEYTLFSSNNKQENSYFIFLPIGTSAYK